MKAQLVATLPLELPSAPAIFRCVSTAMRDRRVLPRTGNLRRCAEAFAAWRLAEQTITFSP